MSSQTMHSIKTEQLGVGYTKFPVVDNISLALEPG